MPAIRTNDPHGAQRPDAANATTDSATDAAPDSVPHEVTGSANNASAGDARAPLLRRLAAIVYEAVLVLAIARVGELSFQLLASALGWINPDSGWRVMGLTRHFLQGWLALLIGSYFCAFWHRGQTVAMRAWRLRLVDPFDRAPSLGACLIRLAVASVMIMPAVVGALWLREHPLSIAGWAALLPAIIGFGWSAIDRDHRALHDRLAGTHLILTPVSAARPTTS